MTSVIMLLSSCFVFANKDSCKGFFSQSLQDAKVIYRHIAAPVYKNKAGKWVTSNKKPLHKQDMQEKLWLVMLNKPSLLFKKTEKKPEDNRFTISRDDLVEDLRKNNPEKFKQHSDLIERVTVIVTNLESFIESGADMYAKDEHGFTLLDYLASSGNRDLVQALDQISIKTVKPGYRSILQKLIKGLSFSSYNPSDYKQAILIAEKMKQELEKQNKEDVEVFVNQYLSYDEVIDYLKFQIPEARKNQIRNIIFAVEGAGLLIWLLSLYS